MGRVVAYTNRKTIQRRIAVANGKSNKRVSFGGALNITYN